MWYRSRGMKACRYWALLLILYVGYDLLDPSNPGAFFFDNDAFFVDGVAQREAPEVLGPPLKERPLSFGRALWLPNVPRVPSKPARTTLHPPASTRRTLSRPDTLGSGTPPSPPEDH